MRETPEELNELQALLDASLSRSTAHLRSIVAGAHPDRGAAHPDPHRHVHPRPVHRDGEGRAADQRCGRAFPARQVALRHGAQRRQGPPLAARPAASVAHMRGEDLGVFTHGTVEILNPQDGEPAADWPDLLAYFKDFYGDDAFDWDNDVVYYRLHPHWMTVYAPDVAKLTAG